MLLEQMFPSLLLATKEFQEQTGGAWEVIVVDDGSVDDTIPWIETIPEKNIKLITRRRKSGFALACNLGFSACHHEIVILLNNDIIVDKGFILPLAASPAETAQALGMSEGAVKVAVHRLRKKFRELLRQETAKTLTDESDVEDELHYLCSVHG